MGTFRIIASVLALLLGLPRAAAEPRALVDALVVPGFRPAAVIRASRPGPRPLVVGLHGNFDRPEWFCASLEQLLDGRAYGLCPRGLPRSDVPRAMDRWTHPGRARAHAELEAGIEALRRREGAALAEGPLLLSGFSLGAILASRLALESPARFPRLYLVEGGQAVWTSPALRRFARGGGRGLLFGCGGVGCAAQAERICRQAVALRLSCQVATVKGLGHSYTEPLPDRARPGFDVLIRGDRRW